MASQRPEPDRALDLREREIVAQLRRRDQRGLRSLLEIAAPRVAWWLRNEFPTVVGEPEIDDALAEAAVRVWRNIDRFDSTKGSLAGWFYVIARNVARSRITRDLSRPCVLLDDWSSLEAPSSEEPSSGLTPKQARFHADLRSCVARLPRLQRVVIEADLASPTGLADTGSLAKALGSSRSSIYTARSSGRRSIRQGLVRLGHFSENGLDEPRNEETVP